MCLPPLLVVLRLGGLTFRRLGDVRHGGEHEPVALTCAMGTFGTVGKQPASHAGQAVRHNGCVTVRDPLAMRRYATMPGASFLAAGRRSCRARGVVRVGDYYPSGVRETPSSRSWSFAQFHRTTS